MDNELQNLDLIDRYLNGELDEQALQAFRQKLAHDQLLQKELEVMQKMYQNLESWSDRRVKQRLHSYFDNYEQERRLQKQRTKKRNNHRILYFTLGIAASLLFVIGYFQVYNFNQETEIAQNNNDTTKSSAQDDSSQNKVNSEVNTSWEEGLLTLGDDQHQLPPEQIRTVQYPADLMYSFDEKRIVIYGDPLLPQLGIEVYKRDTQYLLRIKDQDYPINRTAQKKVLTSKNLPVENGNISQEVIEVNIADISGLDRTYNKLKVYLINPELPIKKYAFTLLDKQLVLILEGNFKPENCQVTHLSSDEITGYYLFYDESTYKLDMSITKTSFLLDAQDLSDFEKRLFSSNNLVMKSVYLLE